MNFGGRKGNVQNNVLIILKSDYRIACSTASCVIKAEIQQICVTCYTNL